MRFACFVDYSNLLGSLKRLNLRVNDYQSFFQYVLKEGYKVVLTSYLNHAPQPEAYISRVYWYAVGKLDGYDFNGSHTRGVLERIFNSNNELKNAYKSIVGPQNPGISPTELQQRAFTAFYSDRQAWYMERKERIEGFCGFYDKVRRESDFIDINDIGHWKLDFVSKEVDEKGVDTALAVDSVTMLDTYDVALIVSGDADMIPSINYLKRQGKHVGVVTFINGYPPEASGRQQSQRLSKAADFDVPIYEMDLSRLGCAEVFQGGGAI